MPDNFPSPRILSDNALFPFHSGGNLPDMNRVTLATFSSFDTGRQPSDSEPERFYHGFVLGLMVDLADRYLVRSNRESGFGRYDVMLEPRKKEDYAYILEFKVKNPRKEKHENFCCKSDDNPVQYKQKSVYVVKQATRKSINRF